MAIDPTTVSLMSSASLIEYTMQLGLYPISMLVFQENDPMASGHSALARFVARPSMAPVSCLLRLLLPGYVCKNRRSVGLNPDSVS